MRTAYFIVGGLVLLALVLGFTRSGPQRRGAIGGFVLVWFGVAAWNLWMGVSGAGYSLVEEAPVFAAIFGIPAVAALLLSRKKS